MTIKITILVVITQDIKSRHQWAGGDNRTEARHQWAGGDHGTEARHQWAGGDHGI